MTHLFILLASQLGVICQHFVNILYYVRDEKVSRTSSYQKVWNPGKQLKWKEDKQSPSEQEFCSCSLSTADKLKGVQRRKRGDETIAPSRKVLFDAHLSLRHPLDFQDLITP